MQNTPTVESKSKQQNTSAGSAPPVNGSPALQQHGRLDAFQLPLLSFGALKTIQRKAAHSSSAQIASLQSTLGNQATRALMRSPAAGVASNVNHYEQEADRIADQVMTLPSLRRFSVTRVPAPVTPPAVQRACACGGHNSGGSCAACAENEALQRKASAPGTPSRAAQSVSRVVRSTGHTLDPGTRAFMERRLGYDFSAVRLHTDAQAAESARAVDAHAYTLGPHIVFASGQYAPRSERGRRLLAHELVHVMQQGATSPPQGADNLASYDLTSPGLILTLQRQCPTGRTNIGNTVPSPACEVPNFSPAGAVDRYLFCFDSTELQPGEEARVLASVARLRLATAIEVHGYASVDGPAAYNLSLSCHRANRLMALLTGAGLPAVLFRTFKHGETSEMGGTLEPNRTGLVVATFGCNCVEELVLNSSGAIEGTFGIDQYWPGVTPYWGSNTALGQFDIAGAGGAHTLGHKFQMVGRFSRSSSRVSPGDVSFQQMARLTVGAAAPGVVGAWFDDMDYTDAGGGVHHWDPNAESGTTSRAGYPGVRRTIATDKYAYTDPPAISYQAGVTNTYRKLEFHVYFRSPTGCACAKGELDKQFVQEIAVAKGVPTVLAKP